MYLFITLISFLCRSFPNGAGDFSRSDLLDLVQEYVQVNDLDTPFILGRPGRNWFQRFMRDHPELTVRKSEQFFESRARAMNDTAVLDHWFNEVLRKTMDDSQLHDKPQNIYNVDETGFMTSPCTKRFKKCLPKHKGKQ